MWVVMNNYGNIKFHGITRRPNMHKYDASNFLFWPNDILSYFSPCSQCFLVMFPLDNMYIKGFTCTQVCVQDIQNRISFCSHVVEFSFMYTSRVGHNWQKTIFHVFHMGLKEVLLGNGQCPKSLLISQSIWYLQRKLK
jgi:hypothetical protein